MRARLIDVVVCLALATVWAVLAIPGTALAGKPDKPPGKDKGGGGEEEAIHGGCYLWDRDGDRVLSDGGGVYYDGEQFTTLGLGGFFRFVVHFKKSGRGRSLVLDFSDFVANGLDPGLLPKEDAWALVIDDGSLADWRAQTEYVGVPRNGYLVFGQAGKDERIVYFGWQGQGNPLTVTRIDTDLWTIQSFAPGECGEGDPGDQGALFGVPGSMPFKVTYDGQATPSP